MILNPLSYDRFLDETKLKAAADENLNMAQMIEFILERIENIVGKGENASNQCFLLFPQCFQNAPYLGSLKVGVVW